MCVCISSSSLEDDVDLGEARVVVVLSRFVSRGVKCESSKSSALLEDSSLVVYGNGGLLSLKGFACGNELAIAKDKCRQSSMSGGNFFLLGLSL